MPLDILLPFWGDPALLRETVASVLAQRNDDWVLTVVDDAYPDESVADWFRDLGDPRVTYVRKPVNEGITANYRTCVGLATQEVVVILGCDDVLLPNYVDVVLAAHAAFPGAAVIQPGTRIIDEHGAIVEPMADRIKQRVVRPRAKGPRLLAGEQLATSLLHGDWLYWPSLAFRREVLVATAFRDDMPLIQDLAIVLDVVAAGGSLLLEPTVCFHYRRHGASASSAALLDGRRFAGERAYFELAAGQVAALGWRRAEWAARLHITSRLHALMLIPQVVRRNPGRVGMLVRHAFGPTRP
ncbi:glycosyltransferase family 2 protein [Pengzhenrongella frigida]|uniref:Glycosyltransferase n=1 Tax=Pengzhenrongella frigida TaxID=1259133 RepID=A0A4Q5MZT8_9MICO|nr:glycosyltransferase [Cellulomonas sp. HLT2-17]RYV51382.1 glycosyltransferase [Cellulomonas sp. HLT2-17]